MIVLSGMSSMEQVADNIGYMQDFHALDAEERAVLDQVVALLRKTNTIGCTGCHDCTDGCGRGNAASCVGCGQCEEHCPQRLEIPKLLKEVSRELQKL